MKTNLLTMDANLVRLICQPSSAAPSIEDALSPFTRSCVTAEPPQGMPENTSEDLQKLETTLQVSIPAT